MSQAGSLFNNSGPGGFIQTITGNDGLVVVPTAGNINVVGSGNITTARTAVSTETITLTGTTNHAVQIGNASGSLTSVAVGTTGQVLTGVTGADPVWAAPSFSSLTITGTTGGAIAPLANNWTFATASTNMTIEGTPGTLTWDFSQPGNNLLIGSTGALIGAGISDTCYGLSAGANITSSSSNTLIGYSSGNSITNSTGFNVAVGQETLGTANSSQCVALGYRAGFSFSGTEANNIVIGYNVTGTAADSNKILIGNGSHTWAAITGIEGVDLSTAKVTTIATNRLGSATLTAGTGISITTGANIITIAASGAGSETWSIITADQAAAVNKGYFCNKAGTLALSLPATSAIGDVIEVANENTALGIQFTQAAGQQILIGSTNTTSGAGGTLTTTAVGDTLKIVCKVANTIWRVTSQVGSWTIV